MNPPKITVTTTPRDQGIASLTLSKALDTIWLSASGPVERDEATVFAYGLRTLAPTAKYLTSLQQAGSVAHTAQSRKLWVVGHDYDFRSALWSVDLNSGEEVSVLPDYKVGPVKLTASPKGDFLAACRTTGVEILDANTGARHAECAASQEQEPGGTFARFHPRETLVYIGGGPFEEEVLEYDLRTKQISRRFAAPPGFVRDVDVSVDARYLLIRGDGVYIWDLNNSERCYEDYFHEDSPGLLVYKFFGELHVTSVGATADCIELASGEMVGSVDMPDSYLSAHDATPDGSTLVLGYKDCLVRLDVSPG